MHGSTRERRRAAITIGTATLLATGLASCSSSSTAHEKSGTAGAASGNAHAATVTVTAAKGCAPDRTAFSAGGVTFTVVNKDATAVSEVEVLSGGRIVGEKEN